ncbi:ImmA/IrrE family metallo-endopeptidase [Paeniglutamicibacter antarcticus]|uniref:ImmA/IrrE family metallo-endopeptidase n=1 Tax=Arthrobacter terrae TaxID=2935737 RepID=A0A931CN07_9MICC|nr:ImmA/IrrE family metallo-endopeptidase [Arthrobacter terrae]MBG0738891.1 ImmA/IrrE family metallo-endopeptidase [Arthrobacter terrae]
MMPEDPVIPAAIGASERTACLAAMKIRRDQGLGTGPIADLHELIGLVAPSVDVAILDMPSGMDGMVLTDPVRGKSIIGVATTGVPERQRSSMGHELGHIVFADYEAGLRHDPAARTPEETRADTFARHLLAPVEGMADFLDDLGAVRGELNPRHVSSVVRHFQVSPAIAIIQMHSDGWITAKQKEEWRESAQSLALRYGWIGDYRAMAAESSTPRPPQRLIENTTEGYIRNFVSVQGLAALSGVDPERQLHELEEAGITPETIEVAWADLDAFGAD